MSKVIIEGDSGLNATNKPEGGDGRINGRRDIGAAHASDCAAHNAPAYPAGPCDCGNGGTAG